MRVTPQLDTLGSLTISAAAGVQMQADVIWAGGNYFVGWNDGRASRQRIYAARISSSGGLLDPDGIALTPGSLVDMSYPALADNGSRVFAVWAQISPRSVKGRFLGYDGAPAETVHVADAGATVVHTRIAYDGTNFMVIWVEYSSPQRIRGRLVSGATGQPVGDVIDIASGVYWDYSAALEFDGQNYLVTYSTGNPSQVWGRFYDCSASPVGEPFRISNSGVVCYFGDFAPGPDGRYLHVWAERPSRYDIHGAVTGSVGQTERPDSPAPTASHSPTLAKGVIRWDGSGQKGFLVYDAFGRLVGNGREGRFDACGLAPGAYFISSGRSGRYKVVKPE